MRYRATQPHTASYADPLSAHAGDTLLLEQNDRQEGDESTWPGWIWCVGAGERRGWVPVGWLRMLQRAGTCTLLYDYDAIELTVTKGEILAGTVIAAGWLWATNQRGERGWVPLENLQALASGQTGG